MEQIAVNPAEISDTDYEMGCRILSTSVKRYFALPGVRQEYEKWMQTEEGMRSEMKRGKTRNEKYGKF